VISGAARPGVAVLVAAATIAAVLWRPRGLPEGVSAVAGAVVMVLLGLAGTGHALTAVAGNWNVLLFFAGLMAIAGLADEAGVFEAVTSLALRAGRGSPLRLLLAVCLAGCVVTAFLSNDATALILTPVVALAAQRAGVDPVSYALATSYVADAASALLPVANPVNILTIDATHVALGGYLRVLLLPAVLVALTTVAAIALLLRGRLDPLRAATPRATMSPLVRPGTLLLAGVAGAYVAATALRVPVGPVAAAGAVALGAVVGRGSPARLRRLRADVSWSVLLFVALRRRAGPRGHRRHRCGAALVA
jgi:arsenical pump membrane protein